jgi:hypothetical protein
MNTWHFVNALYKINTIINKMREKRKKKDGETEEHVKTEMAERVIQ